MPMESRMLRSLRRCEGDAVARCCLRWPSRSTRSDRGRAEEVRHGDRVNEVEEEFDDNDEISDSEAAEAAGFCRRPAGGEQDWVRTPTRTTTVMRPRSRR
mmetsp:Transcript_71772/g.233324  ORF Transcript_71772/g.233324 Transcript_71772/m.233324 type:complete len:100 (+) Transcript_71772:106-405(+)